MDSVHYHAQCLSAGHELLVCFAGHAYAAVISACAAGGAWQRAVQLFDQMLQYQIKPDVVSCTALITALGADGQWKRGSQVVDWMLRSGVKPNVRTYTALITAMGNAQKWDLALDLIKRMKTPQAWGTVEPNAYTYSALLKTMGEQVQYRHVLAYISVCSATLFMFCFKYQFIGVSIT